MAITALPPAATDVLAAPSGARSRTVPGRLLVGRPGDPAWGRPVLFSLLVATAVLYLWGLGSSGWGNTFYAGAVQAGTRSWRALFFGSSDAANFITVDKPPAALWVMELSARMFGLNPWSLLVPQALEGVASVGVLYAALRRWAGVGPALVGGAVVGLTPAATLMFRFDNPDALLVLLLTCGAYATVRAVEGGRTRWLLLAGAFVGTAFVAKMLQAFIVVPALGGVYLLAGPPRLARRAWQLLAAGGVLLAAAGWWVLAVELTPAADRPYIGGSQDNSLWNLIFGYNGFGRLTGNETGSVGGGSPVGATTSRWGIPGLTRMFNADFGAQASWLLPACGLLLVAGLAWTLRRSRTDRARAGLVLWGGWTLTTAAVFSLGQGIIHPYYTVALAPGIGGLVATGVALFWTQRRRWEARAVVAAAVGATTGWAWVLLGRDALWHPGLRTGVVAVGAISTMGFLGWVPDLRRAGRALAGLGALGLVAGLAAPAAYSLQTASTAHSGAIPSAGPVVAGFGSGGPPGVAGSGRATRGRVPGFGPGPGRFAPGAGRFAPGAGGFAPGAGGRGFGAGGLLGGARVSKATAAALSGAAARYTWVAATVGAEQAAAYQLATGHPVMAIGGFNGTDPAPALAAFERYVAEGRVHWFIAGSGPGAAGGQSGTSDAARITAWVESHFAATTVGGVRAYDLSTPAR